MSCSIPVFQHKMVSSAVSGTGHHTKSITKVFSERYLSAEDRLSNEFNLNDPVHNPDYEYRFSIVPDF
eukprot:820378-Pleurochrysis_carterae.AAC.1